MSRIDDRANNQLREVTIEPGYIRYPEGSVLISTGNTKVICNASIEEQVPRWMNTAPGEGGWITAEYSMLPRSTHTRMQRETRGPKGRTQEISRLIGRSLRAGFNLDALNGRSCLVDCDVIQADGGTRTAAITGAYCAIMLALKPLVTSGAVGKDLVKDQITAVSVGIVNGIPMLDLCYEEDSAADVDANIIMTGQAELVEIQGTAEGQSFSRALLNQLLDLAEIGVKQLAEAQKTIIP